MSPMTVRQPVVVNTYKTLDTPTTTSRMDSSDDAVEKYQEIASSIKVPVLGGPSCMHAFSVLHCKGSSAKGLASTFTVHADTFLI